MSDFMRPSGIETGKNRRGFYASFSTETFLVVKHPVVVHKLFGIHLETAGETGGRLEVNGPDHLDTVPVTPLCRYKCRHFSAL